MEWEAATRPAVAAGLRVVTLRTGIVLSAGGGLLGRMVPLFRAGLGGRLGSGRQYQPWISLADEVGAIRFLLESEQVAGPVNLAAPGPVRNSEFTAELARAVNRPALLPAPAFALRLALGEFADFGLCGFGHKPLQKPGPPIYFSGLKDPKRSAKRIAKYGLQGWIGIQDTP